MRSKEEFKALIEQAKEFGFESIEIDGIKYTLRRDAVMRPEFVPEMKPEEIIKPLSVFDEMTEEEIQYWHTPYYDEIQERKEAQKKQIEEEKSFKETA